MTIITTQLQLFPISVHQARWILFTQPHNVTGYIFPIVEEKNVRWEMRGHSDDRFVGKVPHSP